MKMVDQDRRARRFEQIVGDSPALRIVLEQAERVAAGDTTVLIQGETGTGKELIAHTIHNASHRSGQPLIKLNCAAIPFDLLESELFGHERGAFTGAIAQKIGRFELADKGTLFLDEVGDIPLALQPKLLRFLQEQEFERLGSGRTHRVDVRLVAATHRDLERMVKCDQFRSDLYYRLNVFPITVPPLRERVEDIGPLVEHYVEVFSRRVGKDIENIPDEFVSAFKSYSWPGNIRELQNIIERSVILCTGDTFWIDEAWLSSQNAPRQESSGALIGNLRSYEKQLIETALAASKGKVAGPNGAAAKLGIPPSTLHLKINQLNIKKNTIR